MNYYESASTAGRTVFDSRTVNQPVPPMPKYPDFNRFIAEGFLKPVFDGFNTAAKNLSDTLTPSAAPRGPSWAQASYPAQQTGSQAGAHRHDHHECGCGCHREKCGCGCGCEGRREKCGCHRDPCHCNCCIVNADLIVYARLGEVRVIPLYLENSWRRERKITTELSPWTSRGGNPAPVRGKLLPPAPEFILPPCGHHKLTLVVEIGSIDEENRLPDVDDCTVAYADLCVRGCDIRPIRIAIAILPRDCEAYEIECGCQCCC
jgi:hypothetical protein